MNVFLAFSSLVFVLILVMYGHVALATLNDLVAEKAPKQPKPPPAYVPFDPDFATIGAIEPVFDEKVTYATKRIEINPETIVVRSMCGEVCYTETIDSKIVRCDPPIPTVKRELRWRPVQ